MADVDTPRTAAGRALLERMAGGRSRHSYRSWSQDILAIEAEAAPAALDAKRLRRAISTVRDSDPATWLDNGDEADAIAAAYEEEEPK